MYCSDANGRRETLTCMRRPPQVHAMLSLSLSSVRHHDAACSTCPSACFAKVDHALPIECYSTVRVSNIDIAYEANTGGTNCIVLDNQEISVLPGLESAIDVHVALSPQVTF